MDNVHSAQSSMILKNKQTNKQKQTDDQICTMISAVSWPLF